MNALGFFLRMRRMICLHSFSALLVTEQELRRKTLACSGDSVTSQSCERNSPTMAEVSALLSLHPRVCAAIRIIAAKNVIFKGFVPSNQVTQFGCHSEGADEPKAKSD